MANITANVNITSVDVTNTPSNITITEDSNFVANVVSTTTAVNVASTVNTINVAALSSVANSAVRTAINVANVSGFGNINYDNTISSNGIITYIGVSNSDILSVVDDNPANIRQHISVSDNGGFGSLTYSNITGIIQYTGTSATDVRGTLSVTNVAGGDGSLSYSNVTGLFTYSGPDQAEANARIAAAPDQVRAHISATGNIDYNSTTGVISESLTTDDIDEGTGNLYYTNARVAAFMSRSTGGADKPFEIWTGDTVGGFGDIWVGDVRGGDITSSGSLTVDTSGSFGTTLIRSNQYEGGVVRVNNAGSWPSIPAGNVYNIISIDTSNASQVPSVGYQERLANSDPSNTWQFSNDGLTYYPLPTSTTDLVEGDNLYWTTARGNAALVAYLADPVNAPITVGGNLDVQGNLNYVNVEDLLVKDNKIVLNYGDVAKDAYIYVDNSNGGYRVPVETFVVGDQDYAPPSTPAPPYGYSAKFGSGALWTSGDIQGNANPCSYVEVGNKNDSANANILPTSGEFTIEGWIQVPSSSGAAAGQKAVIFSQQGKDGANTDANSFYLQLNQFDNKLQFVVGNISHERTSANAITTGSLSSYSSWHHVAVVKYAGTGLSAQANMYVDGNYWQRLSGVEVGDIADSYLTIGNQSNDQGSNAFLNKAFIGSIDEVRISKTARYSGMSFTPPTTAFTNDSNTIALFHFNNNVFDDNAVEDPSIKWDKDFDKWQISSDGNTYSNIGTITNTIAGAGLTGGGADGNITLDVGSGYGITVNADNIEFANSVLTTLTSNITTTANIQADYFIADTEFIGDLEGAISENAFNNTASTLTKGSAVYISGAQGDKPNIALANSENAAHMPAMGIVKENITASSEGQVVISGVMNYASHGFTTGASLWINGAGVLQETKPTSEANLIQKIAKVIGPNHILVQGAGRSNETPNLDDGNIFVGNVDNCAVTADLSNFTYEINSSANIETSTNLKGSTLYANTITTNGNDPVILQSADFRVDNQNFEILNDAAKGKLISRDAADNSGGPDFDMQKARGGFGSEEGVVPGDNMFNFLTRGYHTIGGGLYRPSSLMGFVVDPIYEKNMNYTNGVTPYTIPGEFRITPNYNIANDPEFRIRNDGSVRIENTGKLYADDPVLHGIVTVGNGAENKFDAVGDIELKIARADNSANATMGVTGWVHSTGSGNNVLVEFWNTYSGDLPDGTAMTFGNTVSVASELGNITTVGTTFYSKNIQPGPTGLTLYEVYTDSGLTTAAQWSDYGATIPQDDVGHAYGGNVEYAVTPSTSITDRNYIFRLSESSEDLVLSTNGVNSVTFHSNANMSTNAIDATRYDGKLRNTPHTLTSSGNISGAVSLDVTNGSIFKATVNGDITSLALTNAESGHKVTLILTQGSPTGTLSAGSNWLWAGGNRTLSNVTGKIDVIEATYDGTYYYATLNTDFSTDESGNIDWDGGNASTTSFEFSADGGNASTTSFASAVEGGNAAGNSITAGGFAGTTVFGSTVDGGSASTASFDTTIDGGNA